MPWNRVGGITPEAVPETVHAVLAARIDRLPPEAKRLLQTAAVIGTDADALGAAPGRAGGRGRRCTTDWPSSRPPSSSTRRGSSPSRSTPLSTP